MPTERGRSQPIHVQYIGLEATKSYATLAEQPEMWILFSSFFVALRALCGGGEE